MMNLITVPVPVGYHLAGWRHPDSWGDTVMNLSQFVEMTKTAERGLFDSIFFADGNGVRQMSRPKLFAASTPSDRPAVFEPVTLLSALSQHTKHIGLVATATTTYEEPYLIARKFASLDHLSGGRAGWNVVTTSTPEDALNFSREEHMARGSRYERAREFVEVVKGLWDSWADDAFPQDRATGMYLDPSRVHTLNHKGAHFQVKGPLNAKRPIQGHPVIFHAGQSDAGRELAAAHADCVFAASDSKAVGQELLSDIKGRMAKYGRSPDSLRILPAAGVFVGRTRDEAEQMYGELNELIEPELGVEHLSKMIEADLRGLPIDGPLPKVEGEVLGINSHRKIIGELAEREGLTIRQTYQHVIPALGNVVFKGSYTDVADEMEDWYRSRACDGFMIGMPIMPRSLHTFVDLVIPELQRRGLFRTAYTGRTMRENMGLPTPANPYFSAAAAIAAQ